MKKRTKKYRDTPERKMYREGGVGSRHIELAILGSSVLSKEEQILRLSIVKPAFDALTAGHYTKEQAREVLTVHNVLLVLSSIPGVLKGDVQEFLSTTCELLKEVARQHYQEGGAVLTEEDKEVLWAMYALFVDVLAYVPMRHIEKAEFTVHNRVSKMQNVRNLDEFRSPT